MQIWITPGIKRHTETSRTSLFKNCNEFAKFLHKERKFQNLFFKIALKLIFAQDGLFL
jgi:hypothetical protein